MLDGKLKMLKSLQKARCQDDDSYLEWRKRACFRSQKSGDGLYRFWQRGCQRDGKTEHHRGCTHLNDKGMEQLMGGIATKPIIATHSNLRSICSHKRNLTEEMFQYIVEHKGLVGLNLLHNFVSDNEMKDSKAELFCHVYRMLELGGEDVIACGSDFDGGIESQMDNPAKFASFGEYMLENGISRRIVDKIMFENALHFFEENVR